MDSTPKVSGDLTAGGAISAGAAVSPIEPIVQAGVTALASDWPGFATQTWTEWMNATAMTCAVFRLGAMEHDAGAGDPDQTFKALS